MKVGSLFSLFSQEPSHLTKYPFSVLTRREHGIATIWWVLATDPVSQSASQRTVKGLILTRLVATLGAKANAKKITKKALLQVDIPKACTTVTEPVAPMALRLQGNLL
jgi:N terminus of Rad21 / Rec8 like protein